MENQPITILGSTGSIGTQALEVCENNRIPVKGLAAFSNEILLEEQARRFHPEQVCIYSEKHYSSMKKRLADTDVRVVSGMEGLCETAALSGTGTCLNSVVGMVGLQPTLAAIEAGKTIALANKETLVTGGELVMQSAKEKGVRILPVDSEHSALWQCLSFDRGAKFSKLILTASGGALRDVPLDRLPEMTAKDALAHPNWDMGAKITVDCATMLNKGFEVIEAMHLYGAPFEKVEVVMHRESIVHSMVAFEDGAVLAQMSYPSMELPIQLALTYPERLAANIPPLDLAKLGALHFSAPDPARYPCFALALGCAKAGGDLPCALNAAGEVAVHAFLDGQIKYTQIAEIIEGVLSGTPPRPAESYALLEETDARARAAAYSLLR